MIATATRTMVALTIRAPAISLFIFTPHSGLRLAAYSFSYPHLFISPTFQQPVSMQASYLVWHTRCVPQCERACEQVARCWADALSEDIARNGTLSMAARTPPKIKYVMTSFSLGSVSMGGKTAS
jgi:hypothetical protein